MPLRHAGYRFEPGHAIRVSVASSAWPVDLAVPVSRRRSRSTAATRPRRGWSCRSSRRPAVRATGRCRRSRPRRRTCAQVGGGGASDEPQWRIEEDVIRGTTTVTIHDGGEDVLEDGRRLYAAETLRLTASDREPAVATLDADVVYRWTDAGHAIEIRATSLQTSDAEAFDLGVDLTVDLDGERFFERSWQERIPRRLV